MGQHRTAKETEDAYLAQMGEKLGSVFYALYQEVSWIHARWLEYRKLFAEKETVDLLNRHGGFLFKVVQEALWEQTLLHIAKVTDPPRSAGKDNLSVQRLPGLIKNGTLSSEVQNLVDAAVEKARYAREHRNKRLAHQDLQHATEPSAVPLEGISRKHVEEMLETLREVMNRLDKAYRGSTVAYERFLSSNDAYSILATLRRTEK